MGDVRRVNQSWHEIQVGENDDNTWLQYRDGYFVAVQGAQPSAGISLSDLWIRVEPDELEQAVLALVAAAKADSR